MTDSLDAIRQLYFRATATTIEQDFDRAIDLLKAMASEDERERAVVFMEGLAEMKKQWARPAAATRRSKGAGRRRSSR
jgi:hypothetical protein